MPPAPVPPRVRWWGLEALAESPGHSRGRSRLIVAAMLFVIGLLDYLSGTRVSLDLFYLLPIACSVAWLGWRAGAATAVASIAIRVIGDSATGPYSYPMIAYWNRLIDLSVYLVMTWILHALFTLWRQLDQRVRQRTVALEEALASRDELQAQLFEIGRRERSAIGHDLHDGLGQHLTATAMAADLLAGQLDRAGHPAAEAARTIVRLLQESIAQTRLIARGLLLAAIEPDALVPELEELVAALNRERGTAFLFVARGELAGRIDAATASHLFYIAQEGARNAMRHARAGRVEIGLRTEDDAVELMVADNGRGLPAVAGGNAGIGLRIMAHRTQLIGGKFDLAAAPGGGTQVRCRVPLPALDPQERAEAAT